MLRRKISLGLSIIMVSTCLSTYVNCGMPVKADTTNPNAVQTQDNTLAVTTTNAQYKRLLKLTSPMMYGDDVKEVQTKLKELKYYTGSIDGYFGQLCDTAVRKFQAANGLDVDGIVGQATWSKLFSQSTSTGTVKYSRLLYNTTPMITGDDVKALQQRLKDLGYYNSTVDGEFGPLCDAAVRQFQSKNSLTVDGICGEQTWNKAFSSSAIKNDSSSTTTPTTPTAASSTVVKYVRDLYLTSPNMQGNDVKNLQTKLKNLGFYTGSIDGIFGNDCSNAVKKYEKSIGVTQDGKVTAAIWLKLFGKLTNSALKKIFIDAGHGGSDSGTIGTYNGKNYLEKNFNLAISLEQKRLFENLGYEVKICRDDDSTVDLLERTNMANAWGADIFISNHNNSGGGNGVEVWAGITNGTSQEYAKLIVNEVAKDSGFNSRGVKTKKGSTGLDYLSTIRNANMPSITVEYCFLDNQSNLAKLISPGFTDKLALSVVEAVHGEKYYDRADVNKDGKVNADDSKAFNNYYNKTVNDAGYNVNYDVNEDGIIDVYDLVAINKKIK